LSFFDYFPFAIPFVKSWKKKKKSLQSNTYEREESITFLLKQLQQHLVIITAKFPSDPEIYNTAIIGIDYKQKLFYLDEFIPGDGNSQIRKLQKVLLRTRLDGAIINAQCLLKEVSSNKGLTHYVMYFPKRIKSTQRRESYRVSIPLNKRIQVNMQTESGIFISGFLNNLSFNGIAIRLESNQPIDLSAGEDIPFLTLHLDTTITCEMQVKRISKAAGSTIISGHIEEISPSHQRLIEKFIIQLDREKRKSAVI